MTEAPSGYADAAVRGSAWTAVQVVVNKLAAAGVTLALGYLLTAEQFGVAWFAISAGQFALVLPVVGFIDVLISSPRRYLGLSGSAQRAANRVAASQAVLIAAVGIALSRVYPERHGLVVLMAMVALRPLADAMMVVPLAGLRIGLRYRAISAVDCGAALVSSALSVTFAVAGLGPTAIVLPPIIAIALRGVLYRRVLESTRASALERDSERLELRKYLIAALGWYLAGALFMLEMVVLGAMASTRSLGLFAFAFGLASQLNGIVSFQIASAIQPIISHLSESPARQVEGALRAIRLILAVLVPLLLVQAAVGGSVIRQLWPAKWDDAVLLFQVMSVAQALYACQWPAAFVLRAQGRFATYLRLQAANMAAASLLLPLAAWLSPRVLSWCAEEVGFTLPPDAVQPLGVALMTLAMVAVFSPLMLLYACRSSGVGVGSVLDTVWRPMIAAGPVALAGFVLSVGAERWALPRWGVLAVESGIALLAVLAGITLTTMLHSSTRTDGAAMLRRAIGWAGLCRP